jgi:tetratricopeptide (TPR) repeat protein
LVSESAGAGKSRINFETGGSASCWQDLVLVLALILAVFAVYSPVHRYAFIDIDDNNYVTNARVMAPLSWATVPWAFTHYYNGNYTPLDFLSHNLDVQAFQLNAGRHHDVNVLLHALNAGLLFWVLMRATGSRWRSLMAAALFALHPINVENVAWISERKTMLSTLFFLLAMAAYRRYACDPKQRGMGVVALCFALGLLAKPQVIALPFALLLWDYWPLRRMLPIGQHSSDAPEVGRVQRQKISQLLREKIFLFAIAFMGVLFTLKGESGQENWKYPLYIRLGNAVLSYARYIQKTLWPNHLALMYLHPGYLLPWGQVAIAALVLIGITVLVIANSDRGYLLVGWLWFLGTSVPTIGLVQISVFAMADRYMYIPLIGLLIMICWGVADLSDRYHVPRVAMVIASLGILVALSLTARRQVGYWRDPYTLWTHTLEVTHDNWIADTRLGDYYYARGQTDEALAHYYRSAQDPSSEVAVPWKIALIEHQRGNLQQALPYYQKVISGSKDPAAKSQALVNMGHLYDSLGDSANALRCYREAQRLAASAPAPNTD